MTFAPPQSLRLLSLALALLLGALGTSCTRRAEADAAAAKPRILIAGDSTAQQHHWRMQIYGWGEPFAALFDPRKVTVLNLARGGYSSRSFIESGAWDALLAKVRAGDVVLIQFGHNDGPPPADAFTRPLAEPLHSFGWNLQKMIADVNARGGRPIVLSLTIHNRWDALGRVERDSPYRHWARAVAEAAGPERVGFVDLSHLIAESYESLGREAVAALFSRDCDTVHTNAAGAAHNAAIVLSGLRALHVETAIPDLDALLSEKGRTVSPAVSAAATGPAATSERRY